MEHCVCGKRRKEVLARQSHIRLVEHDVNVAGGFLHPDEYLEIAAYHSTWHTNDIAFGVVHRVVGAERLCGSAVDLLLCRIAERI